MKNDPINPPHYRGHPSGRQCIEFSEKMSFCLGNAFKYVWRCGEKGDALEDLRKAEWYLKREMELRKPMKIRRWLFGLDLQLPQYTPSHEAYVMLTKEDRHDGTFACLLGDIIGASDNAYGLEELSLALRCLRELILVEQTK